MGRGGGVPDMGRGGIPRTPVFVEGIPDKFTDLAEYGLMGLGL